MRRALALWLLLFGVYAATIGSTTYYAATSRTTCSPPSRSPTTATSTWPTSTSRALAVTPHGKLSKGRLNEPYGIGFPLLILPAYALGGATASSCSWPRSPRSALALAYRLALRAAPDPWALGATAAAGLSAAPARLRHRRLPRAGRRRRCSPAPPCSPLKLDERPGWRARLRLLRACSARCPGSACASCPPGIVIGVVAARALWRSRRRTLAIGAVEVALFSVALAVGHQRGALRRPDPVLGRRLRHRRGGLADYLGRLPRCRDLFVDPGFGLLRWAPLFAARLRRALVAVALAPRAARPRGLAACTRIELTAGLCAAVLGVQLVVAVLLAPTPNGPVRRPAT